MLPEIRKILYSTDLSAGSTAAFEHATYIAKKTGAEIHILHIVEKLSSEAKITLQTYVMDSASRHELLQERVQNARKKLDERQANFWDNLHKDDADVQKQIKSINVVEAYPEETILKMAKDLDIDLIVMGTHDKGLLHTFLGSVAKNVLSHTRTPVMIVPLSKR
jgi:nucleotide-binding universal stress UspA family protein